LTTDHYCYSLFSSAEISQDASDKDEALSPSMDLNVTLKSKPASQAGY
jgi:hypothetical protein